MTKVLRHPFRSALAGLAKLGLLYIEGLREEGRAPNTHDPALRSDVWRKRL